MNEPLIRRPTAAHAAEAGRTGCWLKSLRRFAVLALVPVMSAAAALVWAQPVAASGPAALAAVPSIGPQDILVMRGYWSASAPATPDNTTAGGVLGDAAEWMSTVS